MLGGPLFGFLGDPSPEEIPGRGDSLDEGALQTGSKVDLQPSIGEWLAGKCPYLDLGACSEGLCNLSVDALICRLSRPGVLVPIHALVQGKHGLADVLNFTINDECVEDVART